MKKKGPKKLVVEKSVNEGLSDNMVIPIKTENNKLKSVKQKKQRCKKTSKLFRELLAIASDLVSIAGFITIFFTVRDYYEEKELKIRQEIKYATYLFEEEADLDKSYQLFLEIFETGSDDLTGYNLFLDLAKSLSDISERHQYLLWAKSLNRSTNNEAANLLKQNH